MVSTATLRRLRRKVTADGIKETIGEAVTKSVEHDFTRSLLRTTLFRDVRILEQAQLSTRASQSWESTAVGLESPFDADVEIPRKTRLPHRDSFDGLSTYSPPTPSVAEVRDGAVLGPFGLGVTAHGELIKPTVAAETSSNSRLEKILSRSLLQNGIRQTRRAIRSPQAHLDHHVSVATPLVPLWPNYYHWTLECLPRLVGVETYYEQTGNPPTLLIPPDPPSWLLESLEIVGNDSFEYRPTPRGIVGVDQLVVPSYPAPSRMECEWLRRRGQQGNETADASLPSRIYVSRHNANVRQVANDQDVRAVLESFDIVPYALETLSVSKQIELFANAELVVSPHGAGLANLVYGTDPTVLEMFGYKQKTTFYRLAKLLGFEYHAMFCDHRRKDIIVDPDRLSAAIDGILSGSREPILESTTQPT